jgi:uncharacterized membrane protein YccC
LIVSQESIGDTFDSIHGRMIGTLIGVVVALVVGIFGRTVGLPLLLQIAISVTACAAATFRRPTIRVCLSTCPLVLITAPALGTPELVGIVRVSQVLLGAIVGGMMQFSIKRFGPNRTVFLLWKARIQASRSSRINAELSAASHRPEASSNEQTASARTARF